MKYFRIINKELNLKTCVNLLCYKEISPYRFIENVCIFAWVDFQTIFVILQICQKTLNSQIPNPNPFKFLCQLRNSFSSLFARSQNLIFLNYSRILIHCSNVNLSNPFQFSNLNLSFSFRLSILKSNFATKKTRRIK